MQPFAHSLYDSFVVACLMLLGSWLLAALTRFDGVAAVLRDAALALMVFVVLASIVLRIVRRRPTEAPPSDPQ